MTNHVLIACSKAKTHAPAGGLVWSEGLAIEEWCDRWSSDSLPRFRARDLYSGRATRQQLDIVEGTPGSVAYVVSAGAGLLGTSAGEAIPSYESTFGRGGPSVEDWHRLPLGGLSRIDLNEGDRVIAFAPRNYLRAIASDPELGRFADRMVAAAGSALGGVCGLPVNVHPRAKEVLGVASADLNTELIRIFLEDGASGIEGVSAEAESLPPLPVRRRVDDEELMQIVMEHHTGKTGSELVRYVRDDLSISASVERISAARRLISSNADSTQGESGSE